MSELQVVEGHDIVVPLSQVEAEKLDGRIRRLAESARVQLVKVAELVEEAKRGDVHTVLGFPSWTAYLADALGGQLSLPGDSRREVVALLAGEGMSVRAIAVATGVSKSTVDRDLAHVSHDGTADGAALSESDVPQRDTCVPVDAPADGDSVLADKPTAALRDNEPATVTGVDGKTYSKSKRTRSPKTKEKESAPSAARRRRPLPAQAKTAGWELRKAVERIERILADDRFTTQKDTIAPHLRCHLAMAAKACHDFNQQLT